MNNLIDQLNDKITMLDNGNANANIVQEIISLLRDIKLRGEVPSICFGKLTSVLARLSEYCKVTNNQLLAFVIIKVIEKVSQPKANAGKTQAKAETNMRQEAQFKQATYKIMYNFGFNVYSHLFK